MAGRSPHRSRCSGWGRTGRAPPFQGVARRAAAQAVDAAAPGAQRAPLRAHSCAGARWLLRLRDPAARTASWRTARKGSEDARRARSPTAALPGAPPADRSCGVREVAVSRTPATQAHRGLPRGRSHPGVLGRGRPPVGQPMLRRYRLPRTPEDPTSARSPVEQPRQPRGGRRERPGRSPCGCRRARPRGPGPPSGAGRPAPVPPPPAGPPPAPRRGRRPWRDPPRTVPRRASGRRRRRSGGGG